MVNYLTLLIIRSAPNQTAPPHLNPQMDLMDYKIQVYFNDTPILLHLNAQLRISYSSLWDTQVFTLGLLGCQVSQLQRNCQSQNVECSSF